TLKDRCNASRPLEADRFALDIRLLSILFSSLLHPFYQFTQPSVAVSPCSGNPLDFFGSFSVRLLRGQWPQNATHGDQDSSPADPPNARAGDPTDPWPAAHRPPRWLSTVTQLTRPN